MEMALLNLYGEATKGARNRNTSQSCVKCLCIEARGRRGVRWWGGVEVGPRSHQRATRTRSTHIKYSAATMDSFTIIVLIFNGRTGKET